MKRRFLRMNFLKILAILAIVIAIIMPFNLVGEAAALEVRVQGQGALELNARAAGTVLQVDGVLTDDAGQGLPLRDIELSVLRGRNEVLRTNLASDYGGAFSFHGEFSPGHYEVLVRYRGGSHVTEALARESVWLEAHGAELTVHGPTWVHGEGQLGLIRIQATVGGKPLASFVNISVGGQPVATVELDDGGQATFETGPYLAAGANLIRIDLEGSRYRDPAAWELSIWRADSVRVHGEADTVMRRVERGLEVELTVSDEGSAAAGAAIEGATVEVRVQSLGSEEAIEEGVVERRRGRTDPRGKAKIFFSFDEIGPEPWQIIGRALPPEGQPVTWEGVEYHRGLSIWERVSRWLTLIALVAGFAWVARQSVALALGVIRRRLASAKRKKARAAQVNKLLSDVDHLELHELHEADLLESLASTTAQERSLLLQVWDEWSEEPVSGATVTAKSEDREWTATTSEKGTLVLEGKGDKVWTLHIEAAGFVPAQVELVEAMNRRAYRLILTPVPLKIRRMYQWMIEAMGDGSAEAGSRSDDWGRLTPRQIEAALLGAADLRTQEIRPSWRRIFEDWQNLDEEQRVEALMQGVTALVEETNFSGRRYEQAVWHIARDTMQRLVNALHEKREGSDA